jgi:hypothetical protein
MFDISRDMEVSQAMYCPYSTTSDGETQSPASPTSNAQPRQTKSPWNSRGFS